LSYQQSAIAHGYVESAVNAQLTFDGMCGTGTAAQYRSYFVILTLHCYATHAIFEIPEKKRFMYQDYITYQHQTVEVAQQLMLQDLKKCFRKSRSSLKNFGYPAPDRVPTELEEALLHWKTDDAKEGQGLLLQSLNDTVPNNPKQQLAFDTIMESIDHMMEAGQDKMTSSLRAAARLSMLTDCSCSLYSGTKCLLHHCSFSASLTFIFAYSGSSICVDRFLA
jgi:hypothetical protein